MQNGMYMVSELVGLTEEAQARIKAYLISRPPMLPFGQAKAVIGNKYEV